VASEEITLEGVSVSIGFPTGAALPAHTALAIGKTCYQLGAKGINTRLEFIIGSSIVTEARNAVADAFLKADTSHLFWIDSDIAWAPEDFFRVLCLATKYDIVCGAYVTKNERRNVIVTHPDLKNFEISRHGLLKVDGIGLGFTCMRRDVIEAVAQSKPLYYDEYHDREMADIFRLDRVTNSKGRRAPRGEDMAFFADAKEAGYDVWLDPTIQLKHLGTYAYEADVIAGLGLEHIYRKPA
jgi:glycosyltransferase involved in cell wall biosynthesis